MLKTSYNILIFNWMVILLLYLKGPNVDQHNGRHFNERVGKLHNFNRKRQFKTLHIILKRIRRIF